jgi:hypothetical protein
VGEDRKFDIDGSGGGTRLLAPALVVVDCESGDRVQALIGEERHELAPQVPALGDHVLAAGLIHAGQVLLGGLGKGEVSLAPAGQR